MYNLSYIEIVTFFLHQHRSYIYFVEVIQRLDLHILYGDVSPFNQ